MKTHELAKSLNEKQIQNIIGGWEQHGETKKLADFKYLVRLGASEALAMATVLNNYNEDNGKFYKAAESKKGRIMKKFEYEKAEAIFVKCLGGKKINIDQHGFSREFAFTALGTEYKVIWYHNQSTLIIGGMQVMFFDCEISNTWPSPAGAKNKLQFRDSQGNCVAVIVLEWRK